MAANSPAAPVSLLPHASLNFLNSMGVSAKADYLAEVGSVEELLATLSWWRERHMDLPTVPPLLPLGGGSNLILAGDFAGLVIRIALTGRELTGESDEFVWLRVGAGENWHELVQYCLQAHYFGLENLALIPGSVGAAPIQNIGAYGVELCDYFAELSALEISTGQALVFDRDACQFGYRDSIFKRQLQGRYIITSVTLKLRKQQRLVGHYPALQQYFQDRGCTLQSAEQIFAAVCAIRRSKLPDPSEIPNAGSFFQNPIVDAAVFQQLQQRYPGIVGYPVGPAAAEAGATEAGSNTTVPTASELNETGPANGHVKLATSARVKLAAGWLIDHAGWRGYRVGPVGVHDKQALVLVNPGHGSGREVLALAAKIQADIFSRYGVRLVIEPSVVGQ